jgi:hypothetical protein
MTNTIKIEVKWDDENANIESDDKDNLQVNVKSILYKKMDPLFKLDFMNDMGTWVQEEVNRIHREELNKEQRFLYSYVARTPKSSEQLDEEYNDPKILEERRKKAREAHIKTQNKIARIVKGGNQNGRSQ